MRLRVTPTRAARVMVASKCVVEPGAQGSMGVRLLLTVGATAPGDGYWKRPMHRPDWVAYTDGGCAAGMAGWAWNLLHGGDGDADVDACEVAVGYGPVVIEAGHPAFIGASKHTNNTGELSAAAELLRALLEEDVQPRGSRGIIRPDSQLTMTVMLGRAASTENVELAAVVRSRWLQLKERHGENLTLRHVKGHSGHVQNDRVDMLAERGRLGEVCSGSPVWVEAREVCQQPPLLSDDARFMMGAQRTFYMERAGGETVLYMRTIVDVSSLQWVEAGSWPRLSPGSRWGDTVATAIESGLATDGEARMLDANSTVVIRLHPTVHAREAAEAGARRLCERQQDAVEVGRVDRAADAPIFARQAWALQQLTNIQVIDISAAWCRGAGPAEAACGATAGGEDGDDDGDSSDDGGGHGGCDGGSRQHGGRKEGGGDESYNGDCNSDGGFTGGDGDVAGRRNDSGRGGSDGDGGSPSCTPASEPEAVEVVTVARAQRSRGSVGGVPGVPRDLFVAAACAEADVSQGQWVWAASSAEREGSVDAHSAGAPSCLEGNACHDIAQCDLPKAASVDGLRAERMDGADRAERPGCGVPPERVSTTQLLVRQGHDSLVVSALHNHSLHAVAHEHERQDQFEQHEHEHEELQIDESAAHEDVDQLQAHHVVDENDDNDMVVHDLHAQTTGHVQHEEQQLPDQQHEQQHVQQHEQQYEQQQQPKPPQHAERAARHCSAPRVRTPPSRSTITLTATLSGVYSDSSYTGTGDYYTGTGANTTGIANALANACVNTGAGREDFGVQYLRPIPTRPYLRPVPIRPRVSAARRPAWLSSTQDTADAAYAAMLARTRSRPVDQSAHGRAFSGATDAVALGSPPTPPGGAEFAPPSPEGAAGRRSAGLGSMIWSGAARAFDRLAGLLWTFRGTAPPSGPT